MCGMLKIRLKRVGRKNDPSFRVVLTDSKNAAKSGKELEILGNYDAKRKIREIKADRVEYWMKEGAKVSGAVHNMLVDKGVIKGKKINVLSRKTPIKKEEPIAEKPVKEKVEEKIEQTEEPKAETETVAEEASN